MHSRQLDTRFYLLSILVMIGSATYGALHGVGETARSTPAPVQAATPVELPKMIISVPRTTEMARLATECARPTQQL